MSGIKLSCKTDLKPKRTVA